MCVCVCNRFCGITKRIHCYLSAYLYSDSKIAENCVNISCVLLAHLGIH